MTVSAIAIGLIALILATPCAAAEDERFDRLQREQQELDREVDRLREEIETTKPQPTEELERRQGILAREIAALREAIVLPENESLRSAYGLGPAASKVYQGNPGLSIGGYGELSFRGAAADDDGSTDTFDFGRFVL
jgi:hypothetical protein